MPEPQIPMDLSMSQAEYELAYAVAHLIQKADRFGITSNTVLEGNEGNSTRANKHILLFATEAYKIWASLFPTEHKSFIKNTEFELDTERSVRESVKQGGILPVAFPTRLEQLYHVLMPGVKIQDKRFYKPLIKMIPELRRSNFT